MTSKLGKRLQSLYDINFIQYQFYSEQINGMRRFYKTTFLSNEVPLQVFEVEESLTYLFRDMLTFSVCI